MAGALHWLLPAGLLLLGGPAAAQPSGSYVKDALAWDSDRTTCVLALVGKEPARPSLAALAPSSALLFQQQPQAALASAEVQCSGPTRLKLLGGPLLEPFVANFTGVDYEKRLDLPGATMAFGGVHMLIRDSSFTGLTSRGTAALVFSAASNITFVNATFAGTNNSAAGAVYVNESSALTILDSRFRGNAGSQAGAVAAWNSTLLINGTLFRNNTGQSSGGAVYFSGGPRAEVRGSVFGGNQAENGGGLYVEQCGAAAIVGNTFSQNTATKSGGGLFQLRSSGRLEDNYFVGNNASNGGGAWADSCPRLALAGSRFDNNTAAHGSGGLEANQCGLDVGHCTFQGCLGVKGGGVYLQGGSGSIHDCIFATNTANFGGALFRGTTSGALQGNQFDDNYAAQAGGAVFDSHVTGDISGNTFTRNVAARGRGQAILRSQSSGAIGQNARLQAADVTTETATGSGDAAAAPESNPDSGSADVGSAGGSAGGVAVDTPSGASGGSTGTFGGVYSDAPAAPATGR